jgi:hypothetical protein
LGARAPRGQGHECPRARLRGRLVRRRLLIELDRALRRLRGDPPEHRGDLPGLAAGRRRRAGDRIQARGRRSWLAGGLPLRRGGAARGDLRRALVGSGDPARDHCLGCDPPGTRRIAGGRPGAARLDPGLEPVPASRPARGPLPVHKRPRRNGEVELTHRGLEATRTRISSTTKAARQREAGGDEGAPGPAKSPVSRSASLLESVRMLQEEAASCSRSASTIISITSSQETFGSQPSTRRAFEASATTSSISAGLASSGSMRMWSSGFSPTA